jgi:hypothetical protein
MNESKSVLLGKLAVLVVGIDDPGLLRIKINVPN